MLEISKTLIPEMKEKGLPVGDQDIINAYMPGWFEHKDLILDDGYNLYAHYLQCYMRHHNYSFKHEKGKQIYIVHYVGVEKPWMVYYIEHIKASGYNRYIMLRMTHFLTWRARDGKDYTSWSYLYGQENNMLKDEIRSRSRMDTIYAENLKSSFLVLPTNVNIRKDDYLVIPGDEKKLQEQFRVTGYDIQSTEGVEYVTIDPIYEYDLSAQPTQKEDDKASEFFWFNGGVE
jgi:lipopolysaccharide biosynthesis glycosyltransferase